MDFIKKNLQGAGAGNTNAGAATNNPQAGAGGAPGQPAQKDDYVDKAFAAGASKSGHNIDRNTQEKITDGARGLYEKATGSKVSDKVSN